MYRIILDTETANDINCPFVYDFGFAVIDENCNVIETHSFINGDIFEDENMMTSAYYAEKIPQYIEDIKNGKRKLASLAYIQAVFSSVCKKYSVTEFIAHNMRFDYKSLTTTKRYETTSKQRFFFPYGSKFICTLKMARTALKGNEEYRNFCINNGYVTKRNCNRYTAEILYRYITGDDNFNEEHRGLDDALIELEIFRKCLEFVSISDGYLWGE